MNYRIPKKIAVINSFAGYGRCSMTEALPIISAMGVCACPVPTSIFSNHTGFPSHFGLDFTDHMQAYLDQWDRLGVVFDGIYCGFLGKQSQIPIVADFIRRQKQKGCSMVLIDPVMGDHGKPYRTVSMEQCRALSDLVKEADIITPNLTEACILTDIPYPGSSMEEAVLARLTASLHELGPAKIAVTGLMHYDQTGTPDSFLNYLSQKDTASGTISSASHYAPVTGPSRHGTGDIFASILAADALLGYDFSASVKKAADFIGACVKASEELQMPEPDGVCFENFLHMLWEQDL